MDLFLLMYPPTLREITVEMSNLYSTQTKGKHLNLSMDDLLTFYGILLTSGYSTVPRRHMVLVQLTVMYTMRSFQMQCG